MTNHCHSFRPLDNFAAQCTDCGRRVSWREVRVRPPWTDAVLVAASMAVGFAIAWAVGL